MSGIRWKDTGWQTIVATARAFGTVRVKAGIVGEKAGEKHGDRDLTNAEVAAIQEYGTDDDHIPERSWLRATFRKNHGEVQAAMAAGGRRAVMGVANPDAALRDVGAWAVTELRKTIAQEVPPENALSTVLRKKSDHTLIDADLMHEAIGYEITRSGGGPTLDEGHEEFEIAGMTGEVPE
jgi:hypothetical protein